MPVEGGAGAVVVSPAASTLRDEMAVSGQRLLAASGHISMAPTGETRVPPLVPDTYTSPPAGRARLSSPDGDTRLLGNRRATPKLDRLGYRRTRFPGDPWRQEHGPQCHL